MRILPTLPSYSSKARDLQVSCRTVMTLEIGDRVMMGYHVGISCHVIKSRKQNLMLWVKKVKIGNDVFVGAGTLIAIDVVIHDDPSIPVATTLLPNQKV